MKSYLHLLMVTIALAAAAPFTIGVNAQTTQLINEIAAKNKTEGDAFLANNKLVSGVRVISSTGLQYQILKVGTGPRPGPNDTALIFYTGSFVDGTVFDSSDRHNPPGAAKISLTDTIPGIRFGLQLMQVGSHFKLFIPADLAYGVQGTADNTIPPNEALVFDITLLDTYEGQDLQQSGGTKESGVDLSTGLQVLGTVLNTAIQVRGMKGAAIQQNAYQVAANQRAQASAAILARAQLAASQAQQAQIQSTSGYETSSSNATSAPLQCIQSETGGPAGPGIYLRNDCGFAVYVAFCTSEGGSQCQPSNGGYSTGGDVIPSGTSHVVPGVDQGARIYWVACKSGQTATITGFSGDLPQGYCKSY